MIPSDLVAGRIKEARKKRGWSVRQLAEQCAKAGAGGLTQNAIENIERGRRDGEGRRRREVTVDELLALAYVLSVAPVNLLVPIDDDAARYPLVADHAVSAGRAREWIRGNYPLPSTDRRVFFGEVAEHEWIPPGPPTAAEERRAVYREVVERGEQHGFGNVRFDPDAEDGIGVSDG